MPGDVVRRARIGRRIDIRIPVAVAAVPAALERSLVDAVVAAPMATVLQHGYAHRNHALPGARNAELGTDRPLAAVEAELVAGRDRLRDAFGPRFLPVLVPPWNRIAPAVVARLPAAGLSGLSTFGSRDAVAPVPGLQQCNTHVDLIAWRRGRVFIGADAALGRLAAQLAARREATVDAKGTLWVADMPNYRVQKFGPNGGFLSAYPNPPQPPATPGAVFNEPRAVAVSPTGNLNIIDTVNQRIVEMAPDGSIIGTLDMLMRSWVFDVKSVAPRMSELSVAPLTMVVV